MNTEVKELSAFFYELYFDDEDFELKDINSMSLKQLVIYKKQLLNLKDGVSLTKTQTEKFEKFKVDLLNEIPETLSNAVEDIALLSIAKRKIEVIKFKQMCFKINKNLFDNSKEIIDKICIKEEELKNMSDSKYKEHHKIYMNEVCICECGMETIRKNKSRHNKSKVHLVYEAKIESVKTQKEALIQKKLQEQELQKKQRESENYLPKDENGFTIISQNTAVRNMFK